MECGKSEQLISQDEANKKEEEKSSHQQVWSWGAGTDGQLGTGKLEDEQLPQLLPHLSPSQPISMLACGGAHVIALTSGGKVMSWGRGTSGQLGHGDMVSSLYPKPVDSLENHLITHVSAGWSHSGFVSDTGWLFSCGDGSFGQLGHGDYSSHGTPIKIQYFDDRYVGQIACGMRHSLVLLRDSSGNQVYSFGSGKRGQLGLCKERIRAVNLPQLVCGFEDADMVSITANGDHSAALSADGHLYTWGRGFTGASDDNSPRCLVSPLRFRQVALGWNHALLLAGHGGSFMLGGSHHGVLSSLARTSPVKQFSEGDAVLGGVSSMDGVKITQVAAGAEHSVVVTERGEIRTWGWGEHGQLGLGDTMDQIEPQTVHLYEEVQNEAVPTVYCGSGFTYVIKSVTLNKTDGVSCA